MGLLSLILALFWAHWAANTLSWDLKTSIQGSGVLLLRRSRALCLENKVRRAQDEGEGSHGTWLNDSIVQWVAIQWVK